MYKVSKCKVEEISITNPKELVTSIAAVSRGKDKSNNPDKRYGLLLKEAALHSPGRPLEFSPCIVKVTMFKNMVNIGPYEEDVEGKYRIKHLDMDFFITHLARYGYLEYDSSDTYILYTNYRAMIKAGWREEEIPLVSSWRLDDYKIVKITCPFYIWSQLMTHTQLSKISQSDRVSGGTEYWLPDDVFVRIKNKRESLSGVSKYFDLVTSSVKHNDKDSLLNTLITKVSQEDCQEFFKELGYPREIWSRAPYYFKMKTFIMGGWKNDPNTWNNLFLERGVYPNIWDKTWVQKETQEVCKMIEKIVNN